MRPAGRSHGGRPADADRVLAHRAPRERSDASITDLGPPPILDEVGRFRLASVWGPLVDIGKRDEVMIGATGLDGELRLEQTSPLMSRLR